MLGCLIVARFLATIPFCTLCFRNSRELNFGTTRSILSIFDRIRYTLAKFQRKLVEFSQGKQTKTESGKLEFALEFSSSSPPIVEVVSLGRDVSIEDPEISWLRVNTRSRLSTRSSRALYRATRKGEPAADREIILAHTISARFYPALERLIQRYTIPFSLNLRSVVIVRRASKRALFGFYFE